MYRFFFLICLFLGLVMAMLCSSPSPREKSSPIPSLSTSFPRQVQDALGQTFIIATPPQRIVSHTLATDEILSAMCPPQRIAALSPLAFDKRYSNLTDTGHFTLAHQVEEILHLHPDLIFVANYTRAETVELLQTTGAKVFRFAHFQDVAAIKNNIRIVGEVIGEEHRAEHLVMQMEHDLKTIQAHLPHLRSPLRVMSYTVDHYTAGAHTLFDDMVKYVGAINVATEQGIEQYVQISDEHILLWRPDFIITPAHSDEFEQVRRQLLSRPAIVTSLAGKGERIILIDNRHLLAVSHYVVLGIKALAENLYQQGKAS